MSIKNRVPKFRSLTRLKLSFALATDSLLPNEIAFCKGYYKTVFIKDLSMNSFRGVGGEAQLVAVVVGNYWLFVSF